MARRIFRAPASLWSCFKESRAANRLQAYLARNEMGSRPSSWNRKHRRSSRTTCASCRPSSCPPCRQHVRPKVRTPTESALLRLLLRRRLAPLPPRRDIYPSLLLGHVDEAERRELLGHRLEVQLGLEVQPVGVVHGHQRAAEGPLEVFGAGAEALGVEGRLEDAAL
jgi:hypothetical protein